MKRALSLLFGLLLLAIPVEAGAAMLRGDANDDEAVNIADVTTLIDYLLTGDEAVINVENAEVSGDGQVSIGDVTMLIDYLLSGSWEWDVPHTETFTVNGVSFTMVIVDGGTFMMGATEEQGTVDPEDNEYPVHQVTLSSYGIGQTEVTQELWEAVWRDFIDTTLMDPEKYLHPSYYCSKNGFSDDPQRPVENITWTLVDMFISHLNYITGREFRLPTDAEWEFAARGGNLSKSYKYAGSDNIDEVAWYRENAYTAGPDGPVYETHAVATKAPNELGIYDMCGNVWEKTSDVYSYVYPSEPVTNPIYPQMHAGETRSAKGGFYSAPAKYCRVSSRFWDSTSGQRERGLRLALTL